MTVSNIDEAANQHPEVVAYTKQGRPKDTVPVIEIFGPTIQGEGAMIGVKTMFVRFGGCDYRCSKCDSLHAVIPMAVKANAVWMTDKQIISAFEQRLQDEGEDERWVTLSGGNPAMWDLTGLVGELHLDEWKVAVETQGTIYRPWLELCDQVTISPKGPGMGEKFSPTQFQQFLEHLIDGRFLKGSEGVSVKIVVFDQRDFEFAIEVGALLDSINFPKDQRYLSLGNSHPPDLNAEAQLEGARGLEEGVTLQTKLLQDYSVLLEDYLQDPRLSAWKFLPQLHVLVWANKTGV